MRWLTVALLLGSMLWGGEPPHRVLVAPMHVDADEQTAWEGLALTLALQVGAPHQMIPFTDYRRQLDDFGLSPVMPTSLATKMKLAAELNADLLVDVTLSDHQTRVSVIHMTDLDTTVWALPAHDPLQGDQTLAQLATSLELSWRGAEPRDLDFYRAWASTYFTEKPAVSREIMVRLIDHQLAGASFLTEYVDRFGDPAASAELLSDRIYWRDLYLAKSFYSGAVGVSTLVLEDRHHPADFIVHARILHHLNEPEQACRFVNRAESFGFVVDTADPLHALCHADQTR